jgi:hypothetical protein
MENSGTHAIPTPCSAKEISASTVLAVAVVGKVTSPPVADRMNGQR